VFYDFGKKRGTHVSEEWIAGKNSVIEALKSGHPIRKIWVAEQAKRGAVSEIMNLATKADVTVQYVPRPKIDRTAGDTVHQGVLAFVAPYEYAAVDELFDLAEQKGEEPFLIILDHVQDPHNVGSILRTADAVGAHGVIIPKRRAAGLTATVSKASAGAIQYVPVARVANVAQTITTLKERGVWVCGTDADGAHDYRQLDFTVPLALVIGNEGKGMSRLVAEKCDFLARLPLAGHVSSLNASVAAGLLMYEVYRRRFPLE
jgi:23S rRNA (guanosine2251-2'-O)-methyltransferase